MQRTCFSGSPDSQFCFWLMIVSIAIVVLPVARSPMISWRWPRPIGVSASMALMPVASGSCTDLRCITEVAFADGDREDLTGPADRLALLDLVVVAQDDDADLAGVEVQGDAQGAVL